MRRSLFHPTILGIALLALVTVPETLATAQRPDNLIIDGRLEEDRRMTSEEFSEFRKRQFEEYKKTEEYLKEFAESMDEGDDPAEVEEFLFEVRSERYTGMVFGRGD